jgi:hypothetical protein
VDEEAELFRRQLDEEMAKVPLKLLGIRGWTEADQSNDLGVYDDLIVSFVDDKVTKFTASVDPGWHWIKNPMKEYCAQLVEGVHKFTLGVHQGNPALVQAENFHVHRLDKEGKVVKEECGMFELNLHSGGPGVEVGCYSAGCQVIACPEGYFGKTWRDFFDPIEDAMYRYDQDMVPYKLVRRADMVP